MADSATSQDLFELFQKMMNPMAFPFQHMLMPSLSVEEIDKKIDDLRAVESWLNVSIGTVQLSIKTLEYQRALMAPAATVRAHPPENPFMDPKLWPWNFLKPEEKTETQEPPKKRRSKQS